MEQLLASRRNPYTADLYVRSYLAKQDLQRSVAWRNLPAQIGGLVKEFTLNLIPVVGTVRELQRSGLSVDFLLSLTWDAAFFLGGPLAKYMFSEAKTAKLALTGKVLIGTSAGVQAGLGGYQLGTSAVELYRGNKEKAAGHLGEAALRLFGAYLGARPIKKPLEVPHGFFSAEEFETFGSVLNSKMTKAGYSDVQAVLQGSAVTGVRANSKPGIPAGTPFDVIKSSDFDVAIVSPTLLSKAKELHIPLRSKDTRTGPLRRADLSRLGLGDLPKSLLDTLYKRDGRQINFMIFESLEDALKRGPSIEVPR
jgi:hypothetical protein